MWKVWKWHSSQKRDQDLRFMVSEREWVPQTEERYLPEEEQREEKFYLHKKQEFLSSETGFRRFWNCQNHWRKAKILKRFTAKRNLMQISTWCFISGKIIWTGAGLAFLSVKKSATAWSGIVLPGLCVKAFVWTRKALWRDMILWLF